MRLVLCSHNFLSKQRQLHSFTARSTITLSTIKRYLPISSQLAADLRLQLDTLLCTQLMQHHNFVFILQIVLVCRLVSGAACLTACFVFYKFNDISAIQLKYTFIASTDLKFHFLENKLLTYHLLHAINTTSSTKATFQRLFRSEYSFYNVISENSYISCAASFTIILAVFNI